MDKIIEGKVKVIEKDDIDTDIIIPAKYLNVDDPELLGKNVMEGLGEEDQKKIQSQDIEIISAGKNFGCGSSREHAVWALKSAGIKAVIAKSFARIFFRNSINYGLLPVKIEDEDFVMEDDDTLKIDLIGGYVENITKGTKGKIMELPEFMQKIISNEGLLNHIKRNENEL